MPNFAKAPPRGHVVPSASVYNAIVDVVRRRGPLGGSLGGVRELVPMRVQSSEALTTDKRWKYTVKEQIGKATEAAGDMYVDADYAQDVLAYNVDEERNDQSGEYGGDYGNGTKKTQLEDASGKIKAIPNGRIVWVWREPIPGGLEFRFSAPNGVDVPCV